MSNGFESVCARRGRPSVPPEILFSIRSERQLVEPANYNLLYRWFVGLNIENKIWDRSTFSASCERLFNEDLAPAFFKRDKLSARWGWLASDEHFTVDGTLFENWASHKGFRSKHDDNGSPPGRNPGTYFKVHERCNDTYASTANADARLYKKSQCDESSLCHMVHILMENRNGLIVDVQITYASGTVEREATLAMLGRLNNKHKRATVEADNSYDCKAFINGRRKRNVTPHMAAKDKHSAVVARVTRYGVYRASLKVRKRRIEEAFGWTKTVDGLVKTMLIGQTNLIGQALLCFVTYNLVRMGSIGGCWDAHHA